MQLDQALKARDHSNNFAPSALIAFDAVALGRWPRLLHFAPSPLGKTMPNHSDFFA